MEMLYDIEFEEDYSIGNNPDEDLRLLLDVCSKSNEDIDLGKITEAFHLCVEYHKGQVRASGKPYYLHPLKVALILIQEFGFYDTDSIVVSLLHDVIEDVEGEDKNKEKEKILNTLLNLFGKEVIDMINAVTKFKHTRTNVISDKAATYRKLFLALVKDVRVILIKLADRLHNMRTLHYLKEYKQQRIAGETLEFYTPIAHRLGLTKAKMELEDRSLYFTNRKVYEEIRNALSQKRLEFIDYINVFSRHIQESLNQQGVKHILTVVHKHIYEIYKMMQQGRAIEDIDNFYSIVITTESNDKFECYKAHGILVNAFNPVERLVDYIAQPKINWYQSLNTQLYGPDGKLVEVLIRTKEMDKIAEGGIMSNFSLKEGRVRALEIDDESMEAWGEWMENIIDEKGDNAAQIIWDSIKNNIFDSEIIAYTHTGDIIKLPNHSTPIDFAFALGEEKGKHCISAKINGKIASMNYEIKNGDRVEILTSPNHFPQPEWQNFVISQKAEVLLYNYFKKNNEKVVKNKEEKHNFDVKLLIRGDDRPGLLHDITVAIDKMNIRRIALDSSDSDFSGAIILNVVDNKHLNSLYLKLFSIKGIKSVKQAEVTD